MSLEQQLGYFFFDKSLLKRALSRKAYALEQQQHGQLCEDQEAYQVLGNQVLETVVTELLIRSGCTTAAEIIAHKTELLQAENLARMSQQLGVGYFIKLSASEKEQRADEQPDVLSETLAALIGGIYFDGGFSAARETIRRLFQDTFSNIYA